MAVRTMQRSRGPTEYNLASPAADPGRRDPTTERGAHTHTVLFLIGLCVPTHAHVCMYVCVYE